MTKLLLLMALALPVMGQDLPDAPSVTVPEALDGFKFNEYGNPIRTCHKGDTPEYVDDRYACCFQTSQKGVVVGCWNLRPDDPPAPATYGFMWETTPVRPKVHFITFRQHWQDPPLRTNKQSFKSWPFVLSQVGMVTAMIVACRNPRSQEDWASEVPAVSIMVGFDYISERLLGEPIAVGPGIYGMMHYSIAARR